MPPQCPGHGLGPDDVLDRSRVPAGFDHFAAPWWERAAGARRADKPLEAHIYLWVVFNAWLSQAAAKIERADSDAYLVQVAGSDPTLNARFAAALKAAGEPGQAAQAFHRLWPVFKARTLSARRIGPWEPNGERREDYRLRCFHSELRRSDCSPRCFREHQELPADLRPDRVPLDWAHMLSAIYQVRCNLFHGGKQFEYSGDREFTRYSYDILWAVWQPEVS
jgi:hypothetical protein